MENQRSWWEWMTCSGQLTERDRRNQWVAVGWIFIWSLTFVVASFLLKKDLVSGPARWGVAIFPTLVGIGTIMVYRRFLVQADELQRKIQLDALAFGFGVGVIGSVGLKLLQRVSGYEFEITDPMLLMVVAYSLAAVTGARRYS